MERAKKFFGIGKVVPPVKKQAGVLKIKRDEDEIITAMIERIPVQDEVEPAVYAALGEGERREQELRRLLRRIKRQIRRAGITPDEIIRGYPGPVNALLLLKSTERHQGKESTAVGERLGRIGFKFLQNDVWVLPPTLTPPGLENQDSLKLWLHQNITKPLGKETRFVLPFAVIVDLKKVTAERRGIRKIPYGRTIFNLLELEEILPSRYIYEQLKRRGLGIADITTSGDPLFLASAFCNDETMAALEESYPRLLQRLKPRTGSSQSQLQRIARLKPAVLGRMLQGMVPHSKYVAERMITEAQFWIGLLSGTPT